MQLKPSKDDTATGYSIITKVYDVTCQVKKSAAEDQQSRAASGSLHLFAARKISSRTPKVQNPDRAYTVCCTWHTDQPQCNPSSAQVLEAQGSCQLFSIQTKQHKHPNGFEIWSQTMTPDSNCYSRPSSCRLR